LILRALTDAADGRFPPVDGGVTFTRAIAGPGGATLHAVVAFTGHAFIATSVSPEHVIAAGAEGYGMASSPPVLTLLGQAGGTNSHTSFGVTDATLFHRGRGHSESPPLSERTDREDHHRVRLARKLRRDVRVYGDERGLVTLAHGLDGRLEMSVEAEPAGQGKGWGASLIDDGLRMVPDGQLVFAAVAPGNARSLRAFLRLGFTVIASETIIVITPETTP
jgi:hypothetical protein